jgi:peptide/nickel transport system permease protein
MEAWKWSFQTIRRNPLGLFGLVVLLSFFLIAVFATYLMPYNPMAYQYVDGQLARSYPPCKLFWFGTTHYGQDVLSQVILGSRVALVVGFIAALFLSLIGTNVGLIAGYFGGRLDNLLMRITDIAFGVPFVPFAIVLITLIGPSIWNIIITISLLMWRTTARVIRSQVLSLRARPFITAARVSGASHLRIMYIHILPNVLPMSFLYIALGIGWATLTEASLSFLGFGDPRMMSWGQMLYYAFIAGSARTDWWYVLPPGICIALFVISAFMVGQTYEETVNPRLRKRR